jgi:hypothetical protein
VPLSPTKKHLFWTGNQCNGDVGSRSEGGAGLR